jgi:cytochrome c5
MPRAAIVGVLVAAAVFAVAMAAGGDGGSAGPPAVQRAAAGPDGRDLFARMGCGSCHRLAAAGATGEIGPSLDDKLPHHTRGSLKAKILDPAAGSRYSMMPEDFGERMSAAELDALVGFLLAAGRRG